MTTPALITEPGARMAGESAYRHHGTQVAELFVAPLERTLHALREAFPRHAPSASLPAPPSLPALDMVDCSVMLLCPKGRILHANDNALTLLGRPLRELFLDNFFWGNYLECRGRDVVRFRDPGVPVSLKTTLTTTAGELRVDLCASQFASSDGFVHVVLLMPLASLPASLAAANEGEEPARSASMPLEALGDHVMIVDDANRITFQSSAGHVISELASGTLVGQPCSRFIHPADAARLFALVDQVRQSIAPATRLEHRFLHKDGSWRYFSTLLVNRAHDESIRGVVFISSDVTSDVYRHRKLRQREALINEQRQRLFRIAQMDKRDFPTSLAAMLSAIADILKVEWVTYWEAETRDGKEVFRRRGKFSASAGRLLQDSRDALLFVQAYVDYFTKIGASSHLAIDNVEKSTTVPSILGELRARNISSALDIPLWIDGRLTGLICIRHTGAARAWQDHEIDYTRSVAGFLAAAREESKRIEAEEELKFSHAHDALTRLPNRSAFEGQYTAFATAAAARGSAGVTLILLDVDRFSQINDSLGSSTGDALLVSLSQALKDRLLSDDVLLRAGDDEFLVLTANAAGAMEAMAYASAILRAVAQPFQIGQESISVSMSVGVTLSGGTGAAEDLLRQANLALLQAKRAGGSCVRAFTPELAHAARRRAAIEGGLQAAIRAGDLQLHFQPQALCVDGSLFGIEALLRWEHPVYGHLPASEVVEIAEESQMIHHLGNWVIKTACEYAAKWRMAGLSTLPIAVNVSPRQFVARDFAQVVHAIVRDHGLTPDCIELEITESCLLHVNNSPDNVFHKLAELGFRLTIDDFGTGYSNLKLLSNLPVTKLKIDGSLINTAPGSAKDRNIVKAILQVAQQLSVDVIAECVESEDQLRFLRKAGCKAIQGHHFSKALTAREYEALARAAIAAATPAVPTLGIAAPADACA